MKIVKNIENQTDAIQEQTKAYREWSDAIKYGIDRMLKAKHLHDIGLLPYDDNGGTIIFDKINSVYAQLKREKIFAEDSVDEETGEMDKSYTIKVLPRATVKKYYPEYFAQKMFVAETTVNFAGSGKKVMLTLAY